MDGILVNGQRPFSRKITNFMRPAQRLRGDSSRRRAFFALGVALPRGIRCSGGAVAAHAPPCFGRSREPPAQTAAGVVRGRFGAEKNGRLLGENAGESPKSSLLFSKSPQCPSRRRPYTARPFLLCRNRSGTVRAKTRCPARRLPVSALALRRNRSDPGR